MIFPPKVLLIDDDPDDCYLFNDAVSGLAEAYDVTCVNNFPEAVAYLTEQRPALIFLDLNMPLKSGFDCLKELKSENRFKDIPVIIFSSSSYDKDIRMAYEFGASLYFTKPSGFDILSESLGAILSKNWEHASAITASHYIDNHYKSFLDKD